MRKDSRLSRMLHVILHMSKFERPATSEMLAKMLGTNPVVIRRTMSGLRDQGYVTSEKGHGGGWVLARPLEDISLLDIHRALGTPETFAIGNAQDNPSCPIERSVNETLGEAFLAAEKLLFDRMDGISLAMLAEEFNARYDQRYKPETEPDQD